MANPKTSAIFRFGVFELDPRTRELRKKGLRIKLQDQPFQILVMLLEHPGDLVSREEIRKELWPADTFVDFDLGLNTAISRLRAALGDSAENPRFIETLPRRGYRFVGPLPGPCETRALSSRTENGKIRLAVLPLDDYSDECRGDYFSDGMTEEMITQLGSMNHRKLGVIARTSVTRYKGTEKSIEDISRELDVDYVLEGSVRRAGGRVRISVQLIQACDQTHVWAESYERDLKDVLMLQDEVARTIVRAIRVSLTPADESRFTRERHVDPEAYEAYLRGRHYWNKLSGTGWKQARECFEFAIAKDPGFAPAYAGLADCFCKFGQFGLLPPKEAFTHAREAVSKAMAIDDMSSEAHATLAMIHFLYDWDWPRADQEFTRSIALGPQIAIIHCWYSMFLKAMSRTEESLREVETGLALEPFGNLTNTLMGWHHQLKGEFDQAVAQYRKAIELHPDSFPAHVFLGAAYLAKSRADDAIATLEKAGQLADNACPPGLLGLAYRVSGRRDKVVQLIEDLRERSARTFVPADTLAVLSLALSDMDQVFHWLERACDERDCSLALLNVLPIWYPVRSDPRFQSIVIRMNFPR